MTRPLITDPDDCYGFVEVMKTWIKVREDSGYTKAHGLTIGNLTTEMYKSRLLNWLLQGREPLVLPPPTYLSGPQHEIAERGWVQSWEPPILIEHTRFGYHAGAVDFGDLVPYWMIVARNGKVRLHDDGWSPQARDDEEWILAMPGRLTGTWRCSLIGTEDRPRPDGRHDTMPLWEARRIEL